MASGRDGSSEAVYRHLHGDKKLRDWMDRKGLGDDPAMRAWRKRWSKLGPALTMGQFIESQREYEAIQGRECAD